jgi:hypothetical protein
MTPAEAAVLLAKISANDNREVTEAGSRAWAEALPDVALTDALAYLPSFYREATRDGKNWIYPGDVLRGVVATHTRERARIAQAARQAVLDSGDEWEVGGDAMKALKAAAAKYDAEHAVPQIEAPRDERRRMWGGA